MIYKKFKICIDKLLKRNIGDKLMVELLLIALLEDKKIPISLTKNKRAAC